jgi:hypothetical protein
MRRRTAHGREKTSGTSPGQASPETGSCPSFPPSQLKLGAWHSRLAPQIDPRRPGR